MGHKTLVGGTAYDISGGKALVGGTAYDIKKGRTLVGGTGYDINFGTPLSDIPIGGSVFLNVGGVPTEFLIVHIGNPDTSIYDSSCDGVWLLMKDIHSTHNWNSSNTSVTYYDYSELHSYLNNDVLSEFDTDVQDAILSPSVPIYTWISTGVYGLAKVTAKVFLLSGVEFGADASGYGTSAGKGLAPEGTKLDYFLAGSGGSDTTPDDMRIAYLNGTAVDYWTRSIQYKQPVYAFFISKRGYAYGDNWASPSTKKFTSAIGVRPAIIMPHNICVDEQYNIIV